MLFLFGLGKQLSKLALPALLTLMQVSAQADPVTIRSTVAPDGSAFLYDFAVTNGSSSDPYSILINFSFSLPVGSLISNPAAPAGYGAFADPGSGYLQFSAAEVSGFPVNQTVDGFQFLSSTQFSTLDFGATYLDSTQTVATLFSGVTSPSSAPAVPEPQSLGFVSMAFILLFGWVCFKSSRPTPHR